LKDNISQTKPLYTEWFFIFQILISKVIFIQQQEYYWKIEAD